MTSVRRVAMMISGAVVRYASPGCREWAEGVAREVEFVEGDWSALVWAIGSSRVLLDRREAPMTLLADVAEAARRFSESVRKRTITYIFLFLWVFVYALRFWNTGSSVEQSVSCGLAVLIGICLGIVELMQRRTQRALTTEDMGAWALYYRTELERQRDFYFTGAAIHFDSIVFFIFIGFVFAQDGGARGNLLLFFYEVLVYALWESLILWQRWQLQRRIDELDAIAKEVR
jgi:hypothetical protein